jgi:hypothetical protein
MNTPIQYPAGALLRVKQICSDKPKEGEPPQPGLLPITSRTWLNWVAAGRVPPGKLIGKRTRVWPVEVVLQVGGQAS